MWELKSNFFVNGLALAVYLGCGYLVWVFVWGSS